MDIINIMNDNNKIPAGKVGVTLWVNDLEESNLLIKLAREQKIPAFKNDEIEKSLSNTKSVFIENNKTHAYVEELAKSLNQKNKNKAESKEDNTKNEFLELLKSKLEK